MDRPLIGKCTSGEKILLAYLDLCGTKDAYSKLDLTQQIERISQVVSEVRAEAENRFSEEERYLIYTHMFGDSVVIAEKQQGKLKNVLGLVNLLLNVQYAILQDSASIEYQIRSEGTGPQKLYMPTLSRALVRRGKYYGMVFSDFPQSIENVNSNFSLAGGLAIIEMDRDLRGLPMGTYVDGTLLQELKLDPSRILNVDGAEDLKFVKPDPMPQTITVGHIGLPADHDEMLRQVIQMSGDDPNVISKLTPWVDALEGRRNSIARRIVKEEGRN